MFKKGTDKEQEVKKLKNRLHRLKKIRELSIPKRPRKKLFSKYALKNDVSFEQVMSLKEIDDEIKDIEKQLGIN